MPRHPDAVFWPYHPLGADDSFSLFAAKGWALQCACWDCGREARIAPADLVTRYGPECTIAALHPRLACRCGSRRVHVYVVSAFSRPGQMTAG